MGVILTDSAQAEPTPAELEAGALKALMVGETELATNLASLAKMAREREAKEREHEARKSVLDLEVERAKRKK